MKLADDASGAVAKRSAMTLFSDSTSHYSHRVRIVLAEKGVSVDLVESEDGVPVPELGDLNPYNTIPTLIDRDLVLYESKVMMEYLDERFPHPPLLPVYPVEYHDIWIYDRRAPIVTHTHLSLPHKHPRLFSHSEVPDTDETLHGHTSPDLPRTRVAAASAARSDAHSHSRTHESTVAVQGQPGSPHSAHVPA